MATRKAPVKKVAKKTAAKTEPKTGPKKVNADDGMKSLADNICNAVKRGDFDGYLIEFDDALTERINNRNKKAEVEKPAEKVKPEAKKVSAPPKRTKKVEPEAGKVYKVAEAFKQLAGAKVKFHRYKAGSNDSKVVVEMMVDKPGNPKGKRIAIPVNSLEEVPVSKKPAARRVKK